MLSLELVFRVLVFPGFTFISLLTLICDWVERKIEARMQNRMGPTYTGKAGILQPFADFTKLLAKEDIVPRDSKKIFFKFAPIIAFSIFTFAIFFMPIDGANVLTNSSFEGDLVFVLSLVLIANFFLFLSGWASTNPYSVIGATRVLTQFLGYDIPLFILALAPAFLANSLSFSTIASAQNIPFAILIPWAFILFIATLQAELEKDPFDIPHAETEIVGGYETEYSGRRLAFLKLAKDTQIVLGAAIAVELYLGGPYGPVLFGLPEPSYALWFIVKVLFVVLITEYLTCVFARLRIDQVVVGNWKVLLPLSIVSLMLTIAVVVFSQLMGQGMM
ncbi:NADH-quinone oxidoreductase subunit H [Candidatus Bathyarchaeota archaeon]|nr:MAG: NADH-quinone oxidoreductase subunit H [Candidatus Bathyarchaeota archaeon]RJS81208.1 MAG: NADH-quinone oxidoreductase subunit H [Candidatus Bathyarchaeota archaeon]